jgi:hypothetical protein
MLKKCKRETIVKRILITIQRGDIKTLNRISGELGKDFFVREPRRKPTDATNLDRLMKVIQKIQATCGQMPICHSDYCPFYLRAGTQTLVSQLLKKTWVSNFPTAK